jgi:putative serine/threonine protein kinase
MMRLKATAIISVENLIDEPYASVICYPKPSESELNCRLVELRKLGVSHLRFAGKKRVLSTPVLGKGCVGIVLLACKKRRMVVLKVRRMDADRAEMRREATLLKKANSVKVGPRFLAVSRNFLVMQFVDGLLFPDWLDMNRTGVEVKKVVCEVLEQCWRLDAIGLDHGELSHAPKHIIVNKTHVPFIVDFETASLNRRPSNVTSICQFLFFSGAVATHVAERMGDRNKPAILQALRQYKNKRTRDNFEGVLDACGCQTM